MDLCPAHSKRYWLGAGGDLNTAEYKSAVYSGYCSFTQSKQRQSEPFWLPQSVDTRCIDCIDIRLNVRSHANIRLPWSPLNKCLSDIKTFKKAMSQALKNTTVQTQLKSMYLTEIDSIQNEQFFAIQTQEFRKILNKVKISNDWQGPIWFLSSLWSKNI